MSSAAKNLQCENLTVTDGAQAGLVLTCVSAQGKVAWAAGGGGGGGGQQGFRAKDGTAVITDNAAASVGGDVTGNLMGVDSCVGGPNSVSLGTGSVAVGANSETRNEGSVAVGRDAKSLHVGIYGNVAVGDSASIPNGAGNGVTVGRLATLTSTGFGGVSVGGESTAHASGGVSVGLQAATDVNGVAIGSGASTLGMTGAVSIGVGVVALEADSFNAQHRALTAPVSPSVSGNAAVFNGNELLATPLTMDTDGDISNVVTINGLPYPPPSSTANGYEITNLVQGDIHTDSAGVAAASGIESIAIGCETSNMAIASGTGSIAVGRGAQAGSDNSICLGSNVTSTNPGTFNVLHRDGPFSPTISNLRVAAFNSNELLETPVTMDTDGNITNVTTINGAVIPQPVNESHGYAVTQNAPGDINTDPTGNSTASTINSAAFGLATASGIRSLAIGPGGIASSASGDGSISVGSSASASGDQSAALGESSTASAPGSIAVGFTTSSTNTDAVCLGNGTTSLEDGSFNTIHRAPAASPVESGNIAVFKGRELYEVPSIQVDSDGVVTCESVESNTITTNSITTNSINLLQYVSNPLDVSDPDNRPGGLGSGLTVSSFGGSWLSPPGSPPGLILGVNCFAMITYFPGSGNPRVSVINFNFGNGTSGYVGTIPSTSSAFLRVDLTGYLGVGGGAGFDSGFLLTNLSTSLPTTEFILSADQPNTIRFDFTNNAGADVDVYLAGPSIPGLAQTNATITCSLGP